MMQILGKSIGTTGFGLMGFTWRPQPPPEDQAFKALKIALETGCNFWDGAEFYGSPNHNSLTLLNKYFSKYPEDADKVVLSIKGCLANFRPDNSPEITRSSLENCLKLLDGKAKIDIFGPTRIDKQTPLEDWLKVLEAYVHEGRIGGIGLSEVGAATIRKAASITKIAAVEVELSLWARDIFHNGVAIACAENNIPIIAYSPIGKGIMTGRFKSSVDIPAGDYRGHDPRFQADTLPRNLKLVEEVEKIAQQKGCTPAQLAIAWVRSQSRRNGNPEIIPIPGATTEERILENAKDIILTENELQQIDTILTQFETAGARVGGPGVAYMEG